MASRREEKRKKRNADLTGGEQETTIQSLTARTCDFGLSGIKHHNKHTVDMVTVCRPPTSITMTGFTSCEHTKLESKSACELVSVTSTLPLIEDNHLLTITMHGTYCAEDPLESLRDILSFGRMDIGIVGLSHLTVVLSSQLQDEEFAKYCVYTMMERYLNVIIDLEVVDKREARGNIYFDGKDGLQKLVGKDDEDPQSWRAGNRCIKSDHENG
ncbi:hypothetical protein ACROYT_G015260 [Oculina patagonica]